MLELAINGRLSSGDHDRDWALRLYRRVSLQGWLRRGLARIVGRPSALRVLAGPPSQARGGHLLAVPIAAIVGSEGRAEDFDRAFVPTQEHSRDRWVSVAVARRRGASLPPVRLLRAADGYYVRDGHHRISVARALGEEYVEAEVS